MWKEFNCEITKQTSQYPGTLRQFFPHLNPPWPGTTVLKIRGVRGCCPFLITGSFTRGPRLGICYLQISSVWTYALLLGFHISGIVPNSCSYLDPTHILLRPFFCGVQSWILFQDQRHKPPTAPPPPPDSTSTSFFCSRLSKTVCYSLLVPVTLSAMAHLLMSPSQKQAFGPNKSETMEKAQ